MLKNIKLKKIALFLIGLTLFLAGCSNNTRRDDADFLMFQNERIDVIKNYPDYNMKIAKPIPYLESVNDMKYKKTYFSSYSEDEMLKFYKNLSYRGYGDKSTYWRWKFSLNKDQIKNIVNKKLPKVYSRRPREVLTYSNGKWESKKIAENSVGNIIEIKAFQRGRGGLITKLLIKGNKGTYLVVKESNIRSLLGLSQSIVGSTINIYGAKGGAGSYGNKPITKNPSMLPSGFMAFEKTISGGFNIYGGGFGHGAGMPQWAAMDLTKNNGYSYEDVIDRYYVDTDLAKINSVDGLKKKKVKVGIMTTDHKSIHHSKVSLYSQKKIKIRSKGGRVTVPARTRVDIIASNGYIKIILKGKTKLTTKHNLSISSKEMISVTNIKRNVKKYKYPTYRGTFEVRLSNGGSKINLINIVNIEDYLLQVVPSEMPEYFGLEALKVQAIAARTYAAKDILRGRYSKLGFHILDSAQSQVYNNLDENETATEAIKETKGRIIIYDDKPVDAKYYSTSPGFNEPAHTIW